MPSLKEIKGRIASVNSTRKITSAMKMVASSKLHHAQVAIQNMLPYEELLEHILKSFLAAEAEAQTIYDQERPVKRAALVVFSSNSSLCGGFNANIIKQMTHAVNEYAETIGRDNVEIYPIGRKVYEKARKMGLKVQGEYSALADHPNVHDCIEIAMELGRKFAQGEIDKVELIYHHLLSLLMPKLAHLMLYTALLDSNASEHAARMVAMQTATDNADELLRQLNLQYNKSRQQAITSELLDIVGGSVNN